MKNKKALLVIDMQKGSFTSKTPRFDTKGVVNKINALAQLFKASDLPVIFIQHDGTKENEFIPSTEEWELLDTLEVVSNDIFIDKYANDVFYESKLQSTLTNLAINELYITGCATDFCVESTIQSALTKDYNITVVSDGHTTGERPHLEAEKVIEHYNWVWQNMIPTKGKIEVKSFEEVKNDI
ncbi:MULTISPECIES: isochorismatase family protein [Aquimarina]|uniref:Isochorismatase family protein n=1 Tax=Aquimarina algiphila TaxID=2047982 RepID=A0A554VG62_9FLAO|nr:MULTISPECIES: isochorismatase family protein [Aquimarina]TSE06346.1 isochorismatase family protein [Aquimarina algiphila]